ncbi:MAG: hypothetical protein ACREBU_04290 [Nitrososphaera sp.]
MPSVSKKQARLMAAAAHTKGGCGTVSQKISQKVAKEFNQADKRTGILKTGGGPKRKGK